MDQADTPQKIVVTAPTDDEAGNQVRFYLYAKGSQRSSLTHRFLFPIATDPSRRLPFPRS